MLLLERCDCDLGSLIYPKAGSEEEGQLGATLMMKIATEMADGLAYLHSRGIKHLDMKPGNVLMVNEGTAGWGVRIADFGMDADKENDGDRQSKDDDEVYGTWECVITSSLSCLSLPADALVSLAGTWRRSASAASTAAPHSPPMSTAWA